MSAIVLSAESGMRCEEIEKTPGGWWDDLLRERGFHAPTAFATTAFGTYMREMIFAVPWFLVVRDQDDEPAGLLMAFSEYPLNRATHCWKSGRILASCGHAIMPVLSWPCAPVILKPEREVDIHAAFAMGIASIQRNYGIADVRNGTVISNSPETLNYVLEAWNSAGFSLTRKATFRMDLSLSLEDLLLGFHRSVRKNIRKCERSDVRVERVDEPCAPSIDDYNRMRLIYKNVFSIGTRSADVQNYIWKHLHQDAGCFDYFVAIHGDRVLAGIGIWHFAGYAIEIEAWTTPYAMQSRLPGGDALKWGIIQWGREVGLRWYDLGGVAVVPEPGTKEANIRRFKEKWNGSYVESGSVSRSTVSWRNIAFRVAQSTWRRLRY